MPLTETCTECDGTGWIPRDGGHARCVCLRSRIAASRLQGAKVPERFHLMDFEAFDASVHPSAGEAVATCQGLIKCWPWERGILLRGQTGAGKTHLAVATLREVMHQHGAAGLFVSTPRLFSRLTATFHGGDENEPGIIDELIAADLLVLDEIGARRVTDWGHDVVNEIVTARYDDLRPTILTTNYSGRDLVERVGRRLVSRLKEMCADVHIEAPDYRMGKS